MFAEAPHPKTHAQRRDVRRYNRSPAAAGGPLVRFAGRASAVRPDADPPAVLGLAVRQREAAPCRPPVRLPGGTTAGRPLLLGARAGGNSAGAGVMRMAPSSRLKVGRLCRMLTSLDRRSENVRVHEV
jgi:hypothetical protein